MTGFICLQLPDSCGERTRDLLQVEPCFAATRQPAEIDPLVDQALPEAAGGNAARVAQWQVKYVAANLVTAHAFPARTRIEEPTDSP
jgi:hypothetical protein